MDTLSINRVPLLKPCARWREGDQQQRLSGQPPTGA